ncbi:MAG TPA: DUF3467 domain-containing protein [Gemmataceae bacterium]|jgi:hypothetical protein|nr:DUF3467 domain-containing protein [Gemmataceae bacterium]
MSAQRPDNPGGPERPQGPGQPTPYTQEIQHAQVTARIPEKVSRGVFSTAVIVLQGPHEFVLDFVLGMAQPHQIAARVIVPPTVMPALIAALRENLHHYQAKFGPPPPLPVPPPPAAPPRIEEIYDQLKLPEDVMSGVYANAAMISHTPAEFCFDFITTFFPRSAVSCRVYVSAARLPGVLDSLTRSYQQYQQKLASAPPPPPHQPPL